jgi:hypothetical protein
MKAVLVLLALLLISGCAHWFGPADGMVIAVGSTPNASPCELSLGPVEDSAPQERVVTGEFREDFIVHHSGTGHLVQLVCGGAIVSSRTFKYGRDVGFGGDLPVAGGAP